MSCRLDIENAIISKIADKFVDGKKNLQIIEDSRVLADNEASAQKLADDVALYTGKHVMGWVKGPIVTFLVSPAYIESQYMKLPPEKRTDPADQLTSGMEVSPDFLPPTEIKCS